MSGYDRTKLCAHLRSKNMYYANDEGHASGQDTSGLTELFWCNRTMKNCGPDDRLCDCNTCVPGRTCFYSIFGEES